MLNSHCRAFIATPFFSHSHHCPHRTTNCVAPHLASHTTTSQLSIQHLKMSAPDNEELIDYEDEHDVVTSGTAAPSATNGAAAAAAPAADGDDKKNFSGIHSTGFR